MQKFLLFFFLSLGWLCSLQAQVKVGATPTGKHAKAFRTMNSTKEEAKNRRSQLKLIKEQKKAFKRYNSDYLKQKKEHFEQFGDETDLSQWWSEADSMAIAGEVMKDLPPRYRELVLNPMDLDSLANAANTQTLTSLEEVLEGVASEYLPEDFVQPQNPLSAMPFQGDMKKEQSNPNPNLVKPEEAEDLFKKIDPDKLQKLQVDIIGLKSKYNLLPDARFPMEGRKRNDLENLPFKKRLYLGGSLNASSTDPLIIELNLQVGYWIKKKWMAGTGFTVREQFSQADSSTLTRDAFGFSLFTRYDLKKSFYLWGESQFQVNKSLIKTDAAAQAKWEQAALLGLGREFNLGAVIMTSLIMYDFNYLNNNLNNRPWVFRIGVRWNTKP